MVRPLVSLLFCPLIFARTPAERLEVRHLEAVHAQRIEWMKQRVVATPLGAYQDFRAVVTQPGQPSDPLLRAAKSADVRVVLYPKEASLNGVHEGVLFLGETEKILPQVPEDNQVLATTPKERRGLAGKFKDYPDEVFAVAGAAIPENHPAAFRNRSVHVLARALTESEIRASLTAGHFYLAYDWLCDPAGFSLVAENDLGVYEIGDTVPMVNTHIEARFPVAAKIKLFRNGDTVTEIIGSKISYTAKEEGEYRLEAWLTVDGEDRLWIQSNALKWVKAPALTLPLVRAPTNVEVRKDITYTEGDPADAAKHKLDLYLPKDKPNFPVMLFVHGGSWRNGDRSLYAALGYRFAKLGIGVAVPSYRLMPGSRHPAQIEDVAAAFAWVYKNVASNGVFLAGHSAGGHLVSLLALDSEYLEHQSVPASAILGVVSMSGVYSVSGLSNFLSTADAHEASPFTYVHRLAPPFLITYCQWDYLGLPKQARDFAAALKKDFVGAQLIYVPGKSHITEMLDIWQDDDPTARAILNFVK